MTDKQLLMEVDGIGGQIADRALYHFGNGRKAAQSACRYWNEWTKVDGVNEDMARDMFDRMKDAEVFHDLRGY